jgi:16S rRNA (uracil1498-N3)-methyltransferase
MARRRFFVDAIRGGMAEVRGEDAQHLTRVLRAEAGRQYEITDNQSAYLAEIEEVRGDRVVFRVLEPIVSVALPVTITLFAALIKFDRFEWMIEKTTELGVDKIVPVLTIRSERGLFESSPKRVSRWSRIARESSQQSRRVRSPELSPALRLEAALKHEADLRYFLEENMAPPLLRSLPEDRGTGARIAIMVGPEGGWTDGERGLAIAAAWQPVSLGPQILRAETAAAAAVAIAVNAWCL